MSLIKYNCSWVGIDGGREGLWKEPVWSGVLRIVSQHEDERVYDKNSPIYASLEKSYPNEAWRSYTAEGSFRPLFRDYPNSWTRTGVISLIDKQFRITTLGKALLSGKITKAELLVNMFKNHVELGLGQEQERPFLVIAAGILSAYRPMSTKEIYWGIMKNYRPLADNLSEILKKKLPLIHIDPDPTPHRRLRNMLTLMRTADTIVSVRRGTETFWQAHNMKLLQDIAQP